MTARRRRGGRRAPGAGPAHGPGGRAAPVPAADPAATGRAALVLWAALALLAAGRAVFAFVPGTWLWPLALHRFLSPVAGWGLWLLAAAALVPPLARRVEPALARAGEAIGRSPAWAAGAWALVAGTLAWLAPDRVRFVGDFLLRQGTVEFAGQPGELFPQALPLDVLLHVSLPIRITGSGLLDANGVARVLGALEAVLLAVLAVRLPRTLALRGTAAFACAAVLLFGGYLGMFTGFSKAFAEMSLLVAWAGVSALAAIRTGRGLLPLGLAVATGIVLHRSALGLLPGLVLVWGLWFSRHGRAGEWRRPSVLAAAIVPLGALATMAPRILATILGTDTAVHFTPPEVRAQGGALAAALAGTRPWDLASLVLMLSPLAIAIAPLAALGARPSGRGAELAVLASLALPFVAVMPFIHPAHGLFRDWDDFAATGVALSLIAAWLVGEALRDARRWAWLAVAVALGVAVPAVQWLWVHTDTERGLARVRAFVLEPPERPPAQRGTTWDYLGIRHFRLERYREAQQAFARAAETSPSPRILHEWALAAGEAGDDRTAQDVYRRFLAKDPTSVLGWQGLAATSMRLRDVAEARRAATELARRDPGNAIARAILADIARLEALPPADPQAGGR